MLPQRFAAAMDGIGFFETAPHLAVAVSGGGDSMTLLLLAKAWTETRGGRITALTVDHRLRAASAYEAELVAGWCRQHDIAHVTLVWADAKPARAIQARARAARYTLLENWCREAGVLHLLLGHHQDDQTETVAMRAAMKSGPDGLAGMAVIVEHRDLRLLRPLLGFAKKDLLGWLRAQGQTWLEDPSNRDPRFERARLRAAMPHPPQLPNLTRHEHDCALARILARIAAIHPEGWVRLELSGLIVLGAELIAHVFRRTIVTVAGGAYPPRGASLITCAAWVLGGVGPARRTLAGCRLIRGARHLDVLREAAALGAMELPMDSDEMLWDRRFRLRLAHRATGTVICAAGHRPGRARRTRVEASWRAAATLPALRGVDGAVTVPHVFCERGLLTLVSVPAFDVTFRPRSALGGAAFADLQAASLSSMFPMHADAPASQPHRPWKSLEPQ